MTCRPGSDQAATAPGASQHLFQSPCRSLDPFSSPVCSSSTSRKRHSDGQTTGGGLYRQVCRIRQCCPRNRPDPRRHGTRLDAVDKEWHLTSPTPYDPPLTYGGWTQSRALGARIASILNAREESSHVSPVSPRSGSSGAGEASEAPVTAVERETQPPGHSKPTRSPRRRYKIIIHTSPFLRCVQTAIAISAGISQHRRTPGRSKALYASSPLSRTSDGNPSPLSAIPEPEATAVQAPSGNDQAVPRKASSKVLLRIDAFLGEWLSPDYYEQITPPPSSVMMVASAKAELLRRGEEIHRGHHASNRSVSGYFPGGWRSSSNPVSPDADDDARPKPAAYTVGQRDRTGSHGASTGKPLGREGLSRICTDVGRDGGDGYIPPTPTYAISPSDPIPTGYVAHARDACVEVDYQWDSMREPQNWGDGGEYGEEWSAMHQRFRKGLQMMIEWYRTHDRPSQESRPSHNGHNSREGAKAPEHEGGEEDEDVVLVLVTHGAGCNALIGALTNQPVLLDVGVASLTMAVRKDAAVASADGAQAGDPRPGGQRRRSSVDASIYREYEMKLVASTEHLRAGSTPHQAPPQPFSKVAPPPTISSYRHRLDSRSSNPAEGFTFGESTTRSHARSSSAGPRQLSHARGGSGLWGSFSAGDTASESSEDLVPNFEDPRPPTSSSSGSRTAEQTWTKQLPERSRSQHGLWGSATLAPGREPGKRRWTVTDRRD